MWFKLSLLLLLFVCCINVASTRHKKNIRKSLNQKLGDHGVMDDSPYPVDSDDDVPQDDVEYKNVGGNDDKHPIDVQDEIQRNGYGGGGYGRNEVAATEPNDLMDDSSSDDRIKNKQKLNEKQNGYGNGGYGRNVVSAERKRLQDHGLMDDSSSDDGTEKQKRERFRRAYSTTEKADTGSMTGWMIFCVCLIIVVPILVCLSICGAVYYFLRNQRRSYPGVVYQQ